MCVVGYFIQPVKRTATHRAMTNFGLRVLEEREARGLTQEKLAERVPMSPRQLQRVEAGEANISLLILFKIGRALNCAPGVFFSKPSASTARRAGRPTKR